MKIPIKAKNLLYKASWAFGPKIHEVFVHGYLYLKDFNGREHIQHLGKENPEKTIYCIRLRTHGQGEGLLSIFVFIMSRIEYADKQGWVPFVDVDFESEISWFNRYFSVKNSLKREEVYNSKNVIFSGWNSKDIRPGWGDYMGITHNPEKYKLLEKYIDLTDEIKSLLEKEKEKVRPEQCLGLYLRGTDYIRLRPFGHPIQPTFDEVKERIEAIINALGIERIFLVTEDDAIRKQVVSCYGESVITIESDRQWDEYNGDWIMDVIQKKGNVEENNIIYLVKILLLSQCRAFVGGITNGTVVAMAYNADKYEKKYVHNVGLYT